MQRYSQGRKVPALAMDTFTGKTTDLGSCVYCSLTYTPKDINHISVSYGANAIDKNRFCNVIALVGKTVTLFISRNKYDKADTPTGSDVGSVGGAANHTHAITTTLTACLNTVVVFEAQPPITIIYSPA